MNNIEFKQAWYEHLKDFGRLKFHLKVVQADKLDAAMDMIAEVIDCAAKNRRED